MTQLKPIENLFAVEVPVNANTFEYSEKHNALAWYEGEASFKNTRGINLFDGPYEILFTTIYAPEQSCARVVEWRELMGEGNGAYVNYDFESDRIAFFLTADESLQSLLRSNGLDLSKNYLLIKKTT